MSITVGELLEMSHLRLRLHSGASALERPITWTHTTDLPEPWRWVAGGELLMTNGMPIPGARPGRRNLSGSWQSTVPPHWPSPSRCTLRL